MPSGGARNRSGPAKDPDALRRDRPSDKAGWITLPAGRTDPAPDWPLPTPATYEELQVWEHEWTRPQATRWEALNLEVNVAIYVRRLVEVQQPGATAGLGTLVRQLQDDLGLSITGLRVNGWTIANSDPAPAVTAPTPRAGKASTGSARDRIKIVSSPAPDPTD